MKLLLLVFMGVLLNGCMTPYQIQEQQEEKARAQAAEEQLKCEQNYATSLELAPIREMIPYKPEDATFTQLSNGKKPNKKEKVSLESLDAFSQQCFKTYMFFYKQYAAVWAVNLAEAYQQNQRELLVQLWDGRLTYGQFGEKRIKLQQIRNQILEEERQKRRSGMINDLMMMQALGAFNVPKPVVPAIQPQRPFNAPGTSVNPIQTNCTNVGGSVNCQTFSQ